MKYKYETHCHTHEGSFCAVSDGASLVEFYQKKGYTGAVITDHFFGGCCGIREQRGYDISKMSWEEKVTAFCTGYYNAKKRGEEIGFEVFFGFEYCYKGTEFLIYNFSKEQIIEFPEITTLSPDKAIKEIRERGGFAIHAHPFREDDYLSGIHLYPDVTDAVETLNGGNLYRVKAANDRATLYAKMYDFPEVAGSDRHSVGACEYKGNSFDIYGGIELSKPAKSIMDIINCIKEKKFSNFFH